MKPTNQAAQAALAAVAILQAVMLVAMFTRTAPHPPFSIALFAMAPFLGLSLSLAAAAALLGTLKSSASRTLCGLAALTALVSFGPHKWVDAAISEIWPAVLGGQIAAVVLIAGAALGSRAKAASA